MKGGGRGETETRAERGGAGRVQEGKEYEMRPKEAQTERENDDEK